MTYAKIIGTGSYLPKKILTNSDLEKIVDTSDEWIMKRVGIRERHIVSENEETTCTMATKAASQALAAADIEPNVVELIIVSTASADYFFPSTACIVQRDLGIESECGAMDLNAACAGFIYGLSVVDQYIRNGEIKNALVIGVDTLSTVIDWTDRSTCVLFGDGAGAVVLQASDEPGIISTNIKAAGKYADLLYATSSLWDKKTSGILKMDGHEVFKAAVIKLGDIVEVTIEKAGMQKSNIDWLIPHQANWRIINATAKRLGLPMDRVILTIERHGNTSAASIPLALDEAIRQEKIKVGENLMLEAFGAGFTWGAALVKL